MHNIPPNFEDWATFFRTEARSPGNGLSEKMVINNNIIYSEWFNLHVCVQEGMEWRFKNLIAQNSVHNWNVIQISSW